MHLYCRLQYFLMKLKTLFISCMLLPYVFLQAQQKQHNHIDSIQSAEQIQKFIAAVNPGNSFTINASLTYSDSSCQRIADSLHIQPWAKADFDGNGLTDILVTGTRGGTPRILCIMDEGSWYNVVPITRRSFQDCTFPVVVLKDTPVIEYYSRYYYSGIEYYPGPRPMTVIKQTLVYHFGDFVEYNDHPATHHIEQIDYETGGCYGICPVFQLTIQSDQSAVLDAMRYNYKDGNERNEIKGVFKTKVSDDNYKAIVDLLNYIDFEKLNSSYAVGWTDDQTATLKITYDGGKTKTISDYGLIGTFGLDRLYTLLTDLRWSEKWMK